MKQLSIILILFIVACGGREQRVPVDGTISASRYYYTKDTVGWRLVRELPGREKGSGQVIYSSYMDSTQAIHLLQDLINAKEAHPFQEEITQMKLLLDKATGAPPAKDFTLPGDWLLVSGKDTARVNINSFLLVSGQGIKGNLEALNDRSFLLKKVLPEDVPLEVRDGTLVSPNNKIKLIKK